MVLFMRPREVNMADKDSSTPRGDPEGGGRRQGDRRQAQQPITGEDRRKGERRSGTDRRSSPREDATD
jgi:hypothetical protein